MHAPRLRLLPAPSPADRWIAAVRREIAPADLAVVIGAPSAPVRGRRPSPVAAWVAAVRRELPAA